jgi:hypothetical protein
MRQRIRSRLTYANVMVTILAFVVLGGGTALAAYVVSSNSQIGPGTVSGHKPPSGKHANIIAGSINGTDIADRSGVDTCPPTLTVKLGPICAGSDGVKRDFFGAANYCAQLGLRLPSFSEARSLALNYNIPNIGDTDLFWTDSSYYSNNTNRAWTVAENGASFAGDLGTAFNAVCVTDPQA